MLSGVYRFPAMESVVFGKAFVEALVPEVDRVEARAVFILASGTLARETDTVERLRAMLGNRLAGVCAKIGAHTPRTDVVGERSARGRCRFDGYPRRWLGHRCRQDGGAVPRQRRLRPGAAQRLPCSDQCR